ncbi:hypothetical protein DPC23_16340 [Salmonella enterica subsp. enterica serovar Koketime]|nr:hypothetical protein [Salmonella enterica subsp. enterica serovar Koketime]
MSKDNIDLGTISADSLPTTGSLSAITKTTNVYLQLTCTSPLKYEVSLTDNRADTVIPATETAGGAAYEGRLLGLGETSDGVKIGGYFIIARNVTASIYGTDYQDLLIRSSETGAAWSRNGEGVIMTPLNNAAGAGNRAYVAMAVEGEQEPEASATAEFKFEIAGGYISSALRSITDQQTIDGNVTFNVDYL